MTPEMNPMDPALELAVAEICDETVDSAVVEAAAARVWARIVEAAGRADPVLRPELAPHIRSCDDFQALIPEYRAGRLTDARALLLKDHLHQCVACRRVYEGKVTPIQARPAALPARRSYAVRWAAAAVVVAAAGVSIWFAVDRYGARSGRAYVQTVNGALFEISGAGIRPLAAGQDLPGGVEIRTAKDSEATLQLWDGSTVDLRERSALSSSQSGKDITIHVDRGSVIVQAAKRRSGHLYVATADCRVAVTGTVFSVNAGVKGSRVSVIQGEVRVAQDNQEKVLHPGDQSVSGSSLERTPILYDISWSRNGARLGSSPAPSAPERVSPLLDRAPASTVVFAILPNAADAMKTAQDSLRQAGDQNPQLRAWLGGRAASVDPLLARLQAAGDYLDQVALVVFQGSDNKPQLVFLASTRRPGLGDFLKKEGLPVAVEERPGLAVFGPVREAVETFAVTLDQPRGAFRASPCYTRLAEAQSEGAGAALCADLGRLGQPMQGARYFLGEDRQINGQAATRATIGFDGPRTGIAAWLAAPAPMGSLDYITSEATLLLAFVVKDPFAIVDQTLALEQRSQAGADKALAEADQQTGIDVRKDLAASLGGEFALALDGPVLPTPSWKLIAEVYDPVRLQATLRKVLESYNQAAVKSGGKPWRSLTETVDGRTFYTIGTSDANPLTQASYTFDDGYLIAGPSRAILIQALQAKVARTSIARSTKFVSMMPHDSYANFSAVVYQNLGTTLAPIVGLLSGLAPPGAAGRGNGFQNLANPKPAFIAAYGEPDRITIAGNGNSLGAGMAQLMGGSLLGIAGNALPLAQLQGTRGREPAFR
jgi:ferric-dicitrate binding protein FerR (iron transport regulator)